MTDTPPPAPAGETAAETLVPFTAGLQLLLEASECARQLGRPAWDFAVELEALRDAGLTNSHLRWLSYKRYIDHAVEDTAAGSGARAFLWNQSPVFTERSCFVLTPEGIRLSRQACAGLSIPRPADERRPARPGKWPSGIPHWDERRRELLWEDKVVKRFKLPAVNQVVILAAFEEDGWPPSIDDPISGRHDLDPKQRLHDTIKGLNRNQVHRLLRFRGDGTGCGVAWEHLPQSFPSGPLEGRPAGAQNAN